MKRLFIDSQNGQVRTALTIDGKLREIYIDPAEKASMVEQIILGRLDAILPGQFAFVDIGMGKNAMMNISPKIQLKKGQPVLVQVYKDPTGTKGAYVGMELRFKGRYTILYESPRSEIGVSQKITDEKERKRLKVLAQQIRPKGYGIILRTNANGLDAETISSEIEASRLLHNQIQEQARYAQYPSIIYPKTSAASGQLSSLLSDILAYDLSEIRISGPDYDSIRQLILEMIPTFENSVFEYRQLNGPGLFDAYNLTSQISAALKKTVQLPCGGFITIEQTEACVVIDVNTGRFTGQQDLRATVLKTNTDAAASIAWQLALRNLSGIIIVDFIDMKYEQDKSALLGAFKEEIKKDRIKTEIVGITELGLVQLTRRRTREPLARLLEQDCPSCGGKGRIPANPSPSISS